MAHAAAVSLMQTMYGIRNMESAYEELLSFKETIEILDVSSGDVSFDKYSYSDKLWKKTLEVFGPHLSKQFPSEYRIIRFTHQHILPLIEFVDKGMDRRVGETGHKLRGITKSILSKLRKSLVFPVYDYLEEDMDLFTETVMEFKEECCSKEEAATVLPAGDGLFSLVLNRIRSLLISGLSIFHLKSTQKPEDDGLLFWCIIRKLLTDFESFGVKILCSAVQRFHRHRSNISSKRLEDLEGRIKEAIHIFQDSFESHATNKFLSQQESHQSPISLVDWDELTRDIGLFTQSVKKLKAEYINELLNPLPAKDVCDVVSSRGGSMSKNMVGFSDEFCKIRDELLDSWTLTKPKVVSLVGMAGIGKSTMARKLYEDDSILGRFDHCAWVTIGPKYHLKEIMRDILSQVNPRTEKMLVEEGDAELAYKLSDNLNYKRCFIVLDDVWDEGLWEYLKMVFPEYDDAEGNESRVLLTTRLITVADSINILGVHNMRFLNKEESWNLLREKVFGKELCPHKLVKAGKKIAKNCEGLPLTIVTVAQILSKAEMTPEYWNKVAEKHSSVFKDAYAQMMDVLFPSYRYLPQHLKACFLYMGVFPQNYKIARTKLLNLWSAEGFLTVPVMEEHYGPQHHAKSYFQDLISRTLVLVHNQEKVYSLHSVFWYLCIREAERTKFFHVLNSYADSLSESIKNQRRLCVYNKVLFGIKDAYKSMASVSTARSLLCTGQYHQYPVPICSDLKLLRVLEALTLRFYEFPVQVLQQIQLRYLGLAYDGVLPPSISQLWNLEYLIILPHHRIISLYEDGLYFPIEIWGMHQLKYLQVVGSILPNPRGGQCLENLLKLLDVCPRSCTEDVFQQLPNLVKLGIRVELAPDDASNELLCCFNHIHLLEKLESLKCVVVNPMQRSQTFAPLSISSSCLWKLTLSGCGYSWKDMKVIASLPNLRELKLQCYAFRGPIWEVEDTDGFPKLAFLTIEDADLVHWKVGSECLQFVCRLILKNCYKLVEIPRGFGISNIPRIGLCLYDCNPLAVASAEQLKQEFDISVDVHSPSG